MRVPPKPKCPEKVYLDGILHYTIEDYIYIAPESEASKIMKIGWCPIKVFNTEHPSWKAKMKNLKKQTEDIKKRQHLSWDALNKPYKKAI